MAGINHAVLVRVSRLFKFESLYIKLEEKYAFVLSVSDRGMIEGEGMVSGCRYSAAAPLMKKNNVIVLK